MGRGGKGVSALVRQKVPFDYGKGEFPAKLAKWIGDVFYDVLPEHGYEIRDEQIFTAFKLADAVCRQKVHFAEAELGIGKTLAYLLTAVPYARYTGKPVVIACASTALQEQLAGPKGDIEKLSRLLNLDIDVRMAKDPRQYVCDLKVNQNPIIGQASSALEEVLCWAGQTKRGERSEIPHLPDRVWAQVAWDETMVCESCFSRGYCKLVKVREHYRPAQDLIVCDHGIFFEDLWTREERIDDGKLPILPAYSAVILDEGHKIMLPAAMRAGWQLDKEDLESMLSYLEEIQGARTSLLSIAVVLGIATHRFFETLNHKTIQDECSERLAVEIDDDLLKAADTFQRALEVLDFELQNEVELFSQVLSTTQLQMYEARVERATAALERLLYKKGKAAIIWVDRVDGSLWAVPRELSGRLQKHLFAKKLPVVFSSATLSTGGDFSYFARTLGLTDPSSSSMDSSFEFEKQVVVYLPQRFPVSDQENYFALALRRLVLLLQHSGGRALVLTNSIAEVQRIRTGLEDYQFPFEILWEDRGERGHLLRKFREEVSSVLIGAGFWEGIDVPGEALSLLVIWQLPFPPLDPLIEARRIEVKEQGLDPMIAVDYPEMALKLKQGCGRLIRTQDDSGVIAILEPVKGTPWEQFVMASLPPGSEVVERFEDLSTLRTSSFEQGQFA